MLKFFAWPSIAASSQKTSCVRMKSRRSSVARSEPSSNSMIRSMPGPPSFSYFSAGAVANGRCRDFSVTTSGSAVGDAVLMSLRGAVADGIVFSGVRVAVNNQSIIKMCNFTGGASPAITSLPVRLVTFD